MRLLTQVCLLSYKSSQHFSSSYRVLLSRILLLDQQLYAQSVGQPPSTAVTWRLPIILSEEQPLEAEYQGRQRGQSGT